MGTRPYIGLLVAASLLAVACSEPVVAPTDAELLAEIEGRELTPAELAEKQEVAQLLCGISDEVLIEMWSGMTSDQLDFQDFVFGQVCRDRANVYAAATERFEMTASVGSLSDDNSDGSTTTTTTSTKPSPKPSKPAGTTKTTLGSD